MQSNLEPSPKAPTGALLICLLIAWACFVVPLPFIGFVGLVFNLIAFILAIIVLAKGKTFDGIIGILLTTIGSAIVYGIGWLVFIFVVASANST
jgi:hypothetical protein